jgi:hypothetical protein
MLLLSDCVLALGGSEHRGILRLILGLLNKLRDGVILVVRQILAKQASHIGRISRRLVDLNSPAILLVSTHAVSGLHGVGASDHQRFILRPELSLALPQTHFVAAVHHPGGVGDRAAAVVARNHHVLEVAVPV